MRLATCGPPGWSSVTQHSLGLGADVINHPGGPGFGDGGDDRGGLLVYPGVGDCDMLGDGLIGDVGDHVRQRALAAEDFDGLGAPGVALLGQRAWFVFGLPGFEGRLLGQRKHFHHGGFAAVGDLELFGQLPDAMLDRAAARGEFFIQFCWDADDFAHRPSAWFGGHFGEAGAQFRDEQGLIAGVVKLRRRHFGLVQRLTIQREPARHPICANGLHLVADHQVGVQVRVTGARVAVIKGGGDQSGGVDLGDTVGAHAGKRGVFFEKFESFGDGLMVAVLDGAGDRRRRDRPQGRHGFDWGERQVVAGHGGGGCPGIAGDEAGEFAVICWGPAVGFGEHLAAHRGADPGPDVGG